MAKNRRMLVAVSALVVIATVGLSSSKPSGATAKDAHTYTIGLLTDLTGLAASAVETSPLGIKAGIGEADQEGYHIKYVVADTGSTPNGALVAAQKLVDQDHVFAVIAISGLTFGGASFLTSQGVPVIGSASDSTEWIASQNMFSVTNTGSFTNVYTTDGLLLKLLGVTNLGVIGFGVSPSSADSATGASLSAKAAGVKTGYLNANVPFGTTNVAPLALAMKSGGVNGFIGEVGTNTSFAMVQALRQDGVTLKGTLLPTGYGGDLTQGGPGSKQTAQGLDFLSSFEPVEMHTAATERIQAALKKYSGVTTDPTYAEYLGYVSVDAFVDGLKAAGTDPTQASFIKTMLGITHYTATGLAGGHTVSFGMAGRGEVEGADNCAWVTRYSGSSFHLITGAEPLCGKLIPNEKA
jgi:ABC-type branched-subunit amino acid transport system substrate-binding protein